MPLPPASPRMQHRPRSIMHPVQALQREHAEEADLRTRSSAPLANYPTPSPRGAHRHQQHDHHHHAHAHHQDPTQSDGLGTPSSRAHGATSPHRDHIEHSWRHTTDRFASVLSPAVDADDFYLQQQVANKLHVSVGSPKVARGTLC